MSAPHILLLEDERALARALDRRLRRDGYTVAVCETLASAKLAAGRRRPDLAVLDLRLPDGYGLDFLEWLRAEIADIPAIVMTAFGELDDAIAAMRLGAVDFLKKPLDLDALRRIATDALARETPGARVADHRSGTAPPDDNALIGDSPAMRTVAEQLDRIARLAASQAPPNVLITGETGTGKDRIARLLHARSARADGDFVQVDCAALPRDLIEAELFGHEKGAFTNAHRARRGLLAAAGRGTAFINEIAELPMGLQSKLLTALESRTVREIGSNTEREIEAWFVAATNRDLVAMVDAGEFRQDLYYRLNVLTLHLPPLRERGDDVLILAEHFVADTVRRYGGDGCRLSACARNALVAHPWPGNVRELRHTIERAMLVDSPRVLEARHLRLPAAREAGEASKTPAIARADTSGAHRNGTLADNERQLIARTLAEVDDNVSEAARRLGLSRGALRYRLEKYGLRAN